MGGTLWSDKHYADRATLRAAKGIDTFSYSAATLGSPREDRKIHPSLDPKGVKVRESRDSDAHPESLAVAVIFDVTGSMRTVPEMIQRALPKLMGLLVRRGIEHPQIMVGAIGDATCDQFPLQIGQFESGIEIEDNLTNLILEGGGGGSCEESYELALYFMAKHTSIDCYEKRGKKGFLFIIGDEMYYGAISKDFVATHIGDTLQSSLLTADVVAELQEKYEVYYLMPKMTMHYGEARVIDQWKALLGQNVLMLDNPEGVCELIASTVSLADGDLDSVAATLRDAGTDVAVVNSVTSALADVAKTKAKHGAELTVVGSGAGSGIEAL